MFVSVFARLFHVDLKILAAIPSASDTEWHGSSLLVVRVRWSVQVLTEGPAGLAAHVPQLARVIYNRGSGALYFYDLVQLLCDATSIYLF